MDVSQIFAAPYCALQVAFLGADIIKIEPPGGEALRRPKASPGGVNYSFLMLNANKRSVTLNLKHSRGRVILIALLADADILVENYSSGVMESLGLGYARSASAVPPPDLRLGQRLRIRWSVGETWRDGQHFAGGMRLHQRDGAG